MKRVLKTAVTDEWTPIGGKPIHAAMQYAPTAGKEIMFVWWEQDAHSIDGYSVKAFGTSHEIPDRAQHVTSFVHGALVAHVYSIYERT